MSRHEWERGEIIIPSKEWAGFKRRLREAFNSHQDRLYNAALTAYERTMAQGKGKRDFDFREAFFQTMEAQITRSGDRYGTAAHHASEVVWKLFRDAIYGDRKRPIKPLKKDFPKADSRTRYLDAGEATIRFIEDKRLVAYEVDENNHAVDRAREHPVIRAFFEALDRVQWTPKSGGTIWGNDEYNGDAGRDNPGMGGSYIVAEYSKGAVQRRKAMEWRMAGPRFGMRPF